ncbi:unnamed protein product [Moneuplotes crassus]|uniref:Uncharacterized protein n=1 Tax=Euplotes crassus TaxID=5936 RepID=A0AAD1U4E4_EUPCR|nr:unnamed protein product [Moneuplotes crassus]
MYTLSEMYYQRQAKNPPKSFTDPGIFEMVEPEDVTTEFSTAQADENYLKCFMGLSDKSLTPEIFHSNEHLIEFDQSFYCDKFEETKGTNLEEKLISSNFSEKALMLLNNLAIKQDYYRLRLAAIAYDLNTMLYNYYIALKQRMVGRYVTVVGIELHDREQTQKRFFDMEGILFYGCQIKSLLSDVGE